MGAEQQENYWEVWGFLFLFVFVRFVGLSGVWVGWVGLLFCFVFNSDHFSCNLSIQFEVIWEKRKLLYVSEHYY